jgi:spore maturation protein CgeB
VQTHFGRLYTNVISGVHQDRLARTLEDYQIVVAPDHPITNHYWSNRVYLMSGFGSFILHPYCTGLLPHYRDGTHIVMYRDRADFIYLANMYRHQPALMEQIAAAGYHHTLNNHTYLHRCRQLINIVRERLKI